MNPQVLALLQHVRRARPVARLIPPPPGSPCPQQAPQIAPVADVTLAAALAQGAALVARATAPGLAFTLEELDGLELPETSAARIDRAQLRALASIYLAADLEPAGIISSAEKLAGLVATGVMNFDLGSATPLVEQWWQHRRERMAPEERNAFFARLFGTSSGPVSAEGNRNARFEDRMFELCEALTKFEEQGGARDQGTMMGQVRVRNAARALAQNLGDASSGMTAFIASEVMTTLKEAFAMLGSPDLRGVLRARDIWDVVRAVARFGHEQLPDAQPYVRRGKAGLILLAWLADSLDAALAGGQLVSLGDPVIGAALDWLEATLSLGEAVAAQQPAMAPAAPPDRAASVWSALAG